MSLAKPTVRRLPRTDAKKFLSCERSRVSTMRTREVCNTSVDQRQYCACTGTVALGWPFSYVYVLQNVSGWRACKFTGATRDRWPLKLMRVITTRILYTPNALTACSHNTRDSVTPSARNTLHGRSQSAPSGLLNYRRY